MYGDPRRDRAGDNHVQLSRLRRLRQRDHTAAGFVPAAVRVLPGGMAAKLE